MNVLQVKSATKIYGSKIKAKAIDHLSLSMQEGEFIAIMGASGSGKSTLLNLISGILPLTSGEILINGRNIAKLKEEEAAEFRRTQLGFVFQDFNLIDTLTIQENIMLPMMFQNLEPKKM